MKVINAFFSPVKPAVWNLDTATAQIKQQQIARITKTALFILATAGAIATVLITEVAVVAWPITLTVIAATVIAYLLFRRLNNQDQQYVEGLDQATKEFCAKEKLEEIFTRPVTNENKQMDIFQILENINCLFGQTVFSVSYMDKVSQLREECTVGQILLAESQPKDVDSSFAFKFKKEWHEKGRYGLPSFDHKLNLSWVRASEGSEAINIDYKCSKVSIQEDQEDQENSLPQPA